MSAASLSAPARRPRPRGDGCGETARLWGDEPDRGPEAPPEPASVAGSAVVTLADLVSETWLGLATAAGPVGCPVCGAEMQPRWSAGSGVVGGRCDGCGSTLD